MTKRLLILIMALLLVCASCLADEQVVVDSFKVHVQDIMQPVLATYKKMLSTYVILIPLNMDCRVQDIGSRCGIWNLFILWMLKNDSVMYPYIGILDVERYTEIFTGSYPTKEEASKAEKSYLSNAMQHWRFYYGYQNGKWEKTKVEFYRDTEKRFMSE